VPGYINEPAEHVLLWAETVMGAELSQFGIDQRLSRDKTLHKHAALQRAGGAPRAWRESLQLALQSALQWSPVPETRADWRVKFYKWQPAGSQNAPKSWRSMINAPAIYEGDHSAIRFDWGGGPPANNAPVDFFALVATAQLEFVDGKYAFSTLSDDGVRVFIDDKLVIDNWTWHNPTRDTTIVDVDAGPHNIRVEYFEIDGGAVLQFGMSPVAIP
jgi:hypothetical protein